MKRLLLILVLLPLLGMGQRNMGLGHRRTVLATGHSFAIVHTPTICGSITTFTPTITCTIPATTTGNSVLIFGASVSNISSSSPAGVAIPTPASVSYSSMYGWVISNISAGTTSVSITLNGNSDVGTIYVFEVSGLPTSSPNDTSVGVSQSSYGGTTSTGSLNTAGYNANDVIFGYAAGDLGAWTMPGTGYTQVSNTNCYSTQTSYCLWVEYKVVTATGIYNPGVTQNNGNYFAIGTAALKLQ